MRNVLPRHTLRRLHYVHFMLMTQTNIYTHIPSHPHLPGFQIGVRGRLRLFMRSSFRKGHCYEAIQGRSRKGDTIGIEVVWSIGACVSESRWPSRTLTLLRLTSSPCIIRVITSLIALFPYQRSSNQVSVVGPVVDYLPERRFIRIEPGIGCGVKAFGGGDRGRRRRVDNGGWRCSDQSYTAVEQIESCKITSAHTSHFANCLTYMSTRSPRRIDGIVRVGRDADPRVYPWADMCP